jgi:hypothetical protein
MPPDYIEVVRLAPTRSLVHRHQYLEVTLTSESTVAHGLRSYKYILHDAESSSIHKPDGMAHP